ncbi:hypothetical protein [uncultured Parasutterella sp.]|uniref:hypothetical protein n=1 Tax=uncultured Parasutterella sp. TaxID=1263098 RepID=UPI00272A776D|nr:hypothetical protein [uncultured Parasutterella sp.]
MKNVRKEVFYELLALYGSRINIARQFGVSPAAITRWGRDGVPKVRLPLFKLAFPQLKAWDNRKQEEKNGGI